MGIRRRPLLALAAVGGAGLPGCSGTPQAARFAMPAEGTRLVYRQRDTGSYGSGEQRVEILVQSRLWQGRQAVVFARAGGTAEVRDRDTQQLLAVLGPQGQPVLSYDPPLGVEPPIEVGRRGSTSSTMTTLGTGRTTAITLNYDIGAYESLTLPAGRFRVWVIRIDTPDGEQQQVWTSPEAGFVVKRSDRRTASHAQGAGTRELELVERVPPG